MIDDLDEALRQLLIRELPIKNDEVDVSFDQPKRDWSARVNRPTLNLFLYDLRENTRLRTTQPLWDTQRGPNGTLMQKRRPVRVDLRYLVTAWTTEAEDEHRLLAGTLAALFRFPHLPADLLPDNLRGQPVPIPLQVAQSEDLPNTSDVWSALENTLRPAIVLQVTLALDPYLAIPAGPLVRVRELRFGQRDVAAASPQLLPQAVPDVYWSVGGRVRGKKGKPGPVQVRLVERDQAVPLQDEGRFAIGNLQAGEYTLEVTAASGRPRQFKIKVPAPDYELEV